MTGHPVTEPVADGIDPAAEASQDSIATFL
jgi:hypothetical protein